MTDYTFLGSPSQDPSPEDQSQIQSPTQASIPSYLLAADNHNLGNTQGGSWYEPSTWAEKAGNLGKFAAVSVASGVNSFYNGGVAVGRMFGSESSYRDTGTWISSYDEDLSKYYDAHRESADLTGFIGSMLIPGTVGVKLLNAGQKALTIALDTGKIAENLARPLGLLAPRTSLLISEAGAELASQSVMFSKITATGTKALAAGVWQNTLEAVAFETAVQATMFKSPILEQQDGWDITKNIVMGGIMGGAIGGTFSVFKGWGEIKGIALAAQKESRPFGSRAFIQEGTSPSQKIILMAEDRDLAAVPQPIYDEAGNVMNSYKVSKELYEDKLARIAIDQRKSVQEMTAKGDIELANQFADAIHETDHKSLAESLLHSDQIARIGAQTKVEEEINKLAKAGLPQPPELQVSYVKLFGEDAGIASSEAPVVKTLADVAMNPKAVKSNVANYGFKVGDGWRAVDQTAIGSHMKAQARYIWADSLKEIKPGTSIGLDDFPLLERALKDGMTDIKLVDKSGAVVKDSFASREEFKKYIIQTKEDVANKLLEKVALNKGAKRTVEEGTAAIAKIVNTRLGRLEGTSVGDDLDYFANQWNDRAYKEFLAGKKLPIPDEIDTRLMPEHAKVSYRIPTDIGDGNQADAMVYLKQQQKIIEQGLDNVGAKYAGDLFLSIPKVTESSVLRSDTFGAGATRFGFANGNYGSLESSMQFSGSIAKQLYEKFAKASVDKLTGSLVNLGAKQEAVIEWSTINQKITRSAEQFVRDTENVFGPGGEARLVPLSSISRAQKLSASGEDLADHLDEFLKDAIHIENPETLELVRNHMELTAVTTGAHKELQAAYGNMNNKNPEVFRPIRPQPDQKPFMAFVKNPKIGGEGHTTMLFASTEKDLKLLATKTEAEGYKVIYKKDAEEYYKARGEYEFQNTLHENYIDIDLKKKGIFSPFFTETDPQKVIDSVTQFHQRDAKVLTTELVRAKNRAAFDWLEDQGKQYSKLESSRFGSFDKILEKSGKNPWLDYVKTGLNISKAPEYSMLYSVNKLADSAVSKAVDVVSDIWKEQVKGVGDLDKINAALEHFGMNTAYKSAAEVLAVNNIVPQGTLSKFVAGTNGILAKLTLGLDPINALNNAIGANVLRSPELKMLTDAIKEGESKIAGELAGLGKIPVPGTSDSILSPAKLQAQAFKNFFGPDKESLLAKYKAMGYSQDLNQQLHAVLDDLTLKGTESVGAMDGKLATAYSKAKDLVSKGESLTLNKQAEQFNRFISANVADQITSLGVKHGLITQQEANAYINTFVNRVEGNLVASQRPMILQGPVGQAIGLFQSYQFNLMQQMFRYVAEGKNKDIAMMMGLQGTFYGAQGLPGFQFINQHIIGTSSGNVDHRDVYDGVMGIAGKGLGEFFLYGAPSTIAQINMYSRGDINPRQVTILPTTLADIPAVSAFTKAFSALSGTLSKMQDGAPVWESILSGLEHQGLNRPLAGIAQSARGLTNQGVSYSTSNQGSILYQNDLASLATLSRIAGARPLDEAIQNDAMYRIHAYKMVDQAKLNNLAESVKVSAQSGDIDYGSLAEKYAAAGGKQTAFNQFIFKQVRDAGTTEAEKIAQRLNDPLAQKMQVVMGGDSGLD